MNADELKKLAEELEKAKTKWHGAFEAWYDSASFPAVEYNCEMGFLLGKLMAQEPTEPT